MAMRLIDYFDKGVQLGPARPCLVFGDKVRSYGQVQEATHRIANSILASVQAGARVAVLSANSCRAFESVLGVFRAGCVWVPTNARNVVEETVHQMEHAEVELLFYGASQARHIPAIQSAYPRLRNVVSIDGTDENGPSMADWIGATSNKPVDLDYDEDDLVAIHYTGGTTGMPKGVMHTHRSYEAMAVSLHLNIGTPEPPVFLVSAPMTHAAGAIALATMHTGATYVVLPGFDATEVLDSIERHRVTHLFLPPTAIYMLLAEARVRDRDLSSLKCVLYAGAPIYEEKLREAISVFGPVMCQGYGQTEALPNLTFLAQAEHKPDGDSRDRVRFTSCGRPTLMTRIAIMDDHGRSVEPNECGEVCVQSPAVMKGYWKDPEQTALAIQHGWLHTSDIGFLDDDGYLHIVDRKKDMIVSGGFNIYPAEVEQVIAGHPDVLDCAVIGVPDDKWGEAVKAVVQLKHGASVAGAELEAFCSGRLNAIKVPKSFDIVADLPRSAAGKVLKRVLRDRYWSGRKRKI